MQGTDYRHVVYRRSAGAAARSDLLLVVVDGDGSPWVQGAPARDPTPRRPLALGLLGRAPMDGIYLGRPCYHGQHAAPGCTSALWTGARYSAAVVESMAAAARRELERSGHGRVLLVGYSGGGVLAMLLAPRLPHVAGVVTIAANLDVDAWAAHHRYLPLDGSLDPARLDIAGDWGEWHLVGGRDGVVPYRTVARYLARRSAARTRIYPDFDHVCCWEGEWPAIAAEVEMLLGER